MDRPVIKPLPPAPAFVLREGTVREATRSAARLGFAVGTVLPASFFDTARDGCMELTVNTKVYDLRYSDRGCDRICRLSPKEAAPKTPTVTLSALSRASGAIRHALHEMLTALDGLSDHLDLNDPNVQRKGGTALRSVYRLERTASHLNMFHMLLSGSYPLQRRRTDLNEKLFSLITEAEDLFSCSGIALKTVSPEQPTSCILDWNLVSFVIWELLTNAAAESGGSVSLSLKRRDRRHLVVTVQNRPDGALPTQAQSRWAEEPETPDELGKTGMGLSLVSAAVKCHGGSFLLSTDQSNGLTAMACFYLPDKEDPLLYQFPSSPVTSLDLGLTSFSHELPVSAFDLRDL